MVSDEHIGGDMMKTREDLLAVGILAGGAAFLGFAGWNLMHWWCSIIVAMAT